MWHVMQVKSRNEEDILHLIEKAPAGESIGNVFCCIMSGNGNIGEFREWNRHFYFWTVFLWRRIILKRRIFL